MVAKIIKRTSPKSIKDRRSHHHHNSRSRKKSPIKNASAAVIDSIYSCHRRLIKIFQKLARIGTPNRIPHKQGYQILHKLPKSENPQIQTLCRCLFSDKHSLPPLTPPLKKTVFLDLDETLVHSALNQPPEKFDFLVKPEIDGERVDFYVQKRPFVDEFLDILSKKFEVVVFTAGIQEYASLVLDKLDRRTVISHRLYREACTAKDGKLVKDLSELGRELKSVVIVDDNPNSYLFQPENAIPIRPFTGDPADVELRKLVEFFEGCEGFDDMRDAIKHHLAKEEGFEKVEI